jgi:hypothetical protein
MTVRPSIKERLTCLETTFNLEFNNLKGQLTKIETNHLPHIQAEVTDLRTETNQQFKQVNSKLEELKDHQKTKLSGKDKAVVYGSFLTMLGLVLSQIVQQLL